jgi:hypothetical protein
MFIHLYFDICEIKEYIIWVLIEYLNIYHKTSYKYYVNTKRIMEHLFILREHHRYIIEHHMYTIRT